MVSLLYLNLHLQQLPTDNAGESFFCLEKYHEWKQIGLIFISKK